MRANPTLLHPVEICFEKIVGTSRVVEKLSNPSAPVRIYPPSTSVEGTLARSFAASQPSFFLFSRFFCGFVLQPRPVL
jgi:hypothetical protein